MALAISAVVRPSRILLAMQYAAAAMLLCIALVVVLSPFSILSGSHARLAFAALIAVAGFWLFIQAWLCRKYVELCVTREGELFVAFPEVEIKKARGKPVANAHCQTSFPVRLRVASLSGSTLLPWLLHLRLHLQDGSRHIVRILPDSMTALEFRRLTVACRWIAYRNDPAQCDVSSAK